MISFESFMILMRVGKKNNYLEQVESNRTNMRARSFQVKHPWLKQFIFFDGLYSYSQMSYLDLFENELGFSILSCSRSAISTNCNNGKLTSTEKHSIAKAFMQWFATLLPYNLGITLVGT